jgi:hypothetical protein
MHASQADVVHGLRLPVAWSPRTRRRPRCGVQQSECCLLRRGGGRCGCRRICGHWPAQPQQSGRLRADIHSMHWCDLQHRHRRLRPLRAAQRDPPGRLPAAAGPRMPRHAIRCPLPLPRKRSLCSAGRAMAYALRLWLLVRCRCGPGRALQTAGRSARATRAPARLESRCPTWYEDVSDHQVKRHRAQPSREGSRLRSDHGPTDRCDRYLSL